MSGEASAVARLRVAQEARLPRTAAQIVTYLADDENSASWNIGKVEAALEEWCAAGIVEELPSADPDSPKRYLLAQVFRDDIERRLVANLSQPRTVEGLQAVTRQDPQVGQLGIETLNGYLADLASRGLVVNLGEYEDGVSLAKAAQAHSKTVEMHREKAQALAERLDVEDLAGRRARAWQLDGEQWQMTVLAADALAVT